MFPKKQQRIPKKRNYDLSQFGLTEVPDDFDLTAGFEDDTNDSDLEAELIGLSGGVKKEKTKPKKNLVSANELDLMIAESLKDVESSDEESESVETDIELLNELKNIFPTEVNKNEMCSEESDVAEPQRNSEIVLKPTESNSIDVIKQRIEMYKIAEANAKELGESAKERRFNRGLKSLNELLRQLISGKSINPADIPPAITVKPSVNKDLSNTNLNDSDKTPLSTSMKEAIPDNNDSSSATSSQNNPTIQQMLSLQQEYKAAALKSKRSGDITTALQYLKVVKQFDVVIKMCEDGQDVDLSDMPPPPEQFKQFMENMMASSEQNNTNIQVETESPTAVETGLEAESNTTSETNILEALHQRLSKYKTVEQSAKSEGNASKARRFGRIVKQYEVAIKDYKAGRLVAYEELPIPPGFGPLITNSSTEQKPSIAEETITTPPASPPTPPTNTISPPPQHNSRARTSVNQQKQKLEGKQMQILLDRQKEFKLAAIDAKKAGDIDQAKEYLKMYKGFDALLQAARSGLPVDLSSLPVPPSQRDNLEDSFAIITAKECDPDDDISDIAVRVEEQLAKQLMMCKNTRDHYKAMGDITGMNRFENLALTVQKDLDVVRYSKRSSLPLPKFHYEQRCFNIVHCNTDLTENELEITIVRGISYNVANPKEVDTYVRIDFPLPNASEVALAMAVFKSFKHYMASIPL